MTIEEWMGKKVAYDYGGRCGCTREADTRRWIKLPYYSARSHNAGDGAQLEVDILFGTSKVAESVPYLTQDIFNLSQFTTYVRVPRTSGAQISRTFTKAGTILRSHHTLRRSSAAVETQIVFWHHPKYQQRTWYRTTPTKTPCITVLAIGCYPLSARVWPTREYKPDDWFVCENPCTKTSRESG